ncbi:MAG: hypothetical protein KHX03_01955 [Clostridium sp.]|nr:hypothetical protein [Clostridium sp.]
MEFFVENINLLLFLPLIVCAILGFNGLISNRVEKNTLFSISIAVALICLIFAGAAFDYSVFNNMSVSSNFPWLALDNINFYLGTYLDKISVSFLLGSGVLCVLLQVFAFLKLKDTPDFNRLLLYLNLFYFALNGIFISPNIFQSYLFFEIVGVAAYLLINFDFSNRDESKAAIKSFVFNRIGDLTLLFCVLTILYYAVVYNQLTDANSLSYTNMNNVSASINSLMSEPLFVFFCSILMFVIVMKFMQAFIYLTFEPKENTLLSKVILFQNAMITLAGVYLFMRLNPFFVDLGFDWVWTLLVLALMFLTLGVLNKLFIPFCKMMGWIEKYVVESVINFAELLIRAFSYICTKLQAGNFQSYLIYSLIGLVLIFAFVLIFYVLLIKV